MPQSAPYSSARPKSGQSRTTMDGLTLATIIIATILLTILAVLGYQLDRDTKHRP